MNSNKLKNLLHVSCEGCGKCCSIPIVPVTDADIKRIAEYTNHKPDDFIRLYGSKDFDVDSDDSGWIKMDYGKRAIGLKKKDDRCIFLDENNRCKVYEARPMTCRTFPLAIHLKPNGEIDEIELNTIIKTKYPKGPQKKLPVIKRMAQTEDHEDEKFFNKISKWNKMSKRTGKNDLLKFLKLQ